MPRPHGGVQPDVFPDHSIPWTLMNKKGSVFYDLLKIDFFFIKLIKEGIMHHAG